MQLTPEVLQQFAETSVEKLVQVDSSIVAAYLCGSTVLPGNPLLGGTTDIDVVLIHTREPRLEREILRLTDDVHLDLCHHTQDIYRQGRELRVHPWMGPTLNSAKPIYDPRHFLDFTQASVRGLFHRPDYTIQRAQALLDQARQTWVGLQSISIALGPNVVASYLKAVENAANAVAVLEGEPLTERRLLLEFPQRAEKLEYPRMVIGIMGLLGAHNIGDEQIRAWVSPWQESYDAIPEESRPAGLHVYRKDYYLRVFEAMIDGGEPKAALWPLINSWTLAASVLSAGNPAYQGWREACQQLELLSSNLPEKVAALDAFLDQVEEVLNQWEQESGF
ncbi:MAG TPA: hypothetical protein DEH22_12560 [Chloroflexi bacterium]|nr:hypothetical protein [Chloroflexota bacterium]